MIEDVIKKTAKKIIPLIDLTDLDEKHNEEDILNLCSKAATPYGKVAAVCIYPQFISLVREILENTGINIATVVNFPYGGENIDEVVWQAQNAIHLGANEVDMVFPYNAYLNGSKTLAFDMVANLKKECKAGGAKLKVILETGELKKALYIYEAARIAIEAGADFIKTSTGKTALGATPAAVNAILETIRDFRKKVGLKVSGGVKTVAQARDYLILAANIMGEDWINSSNMRFGASSLLDDAFNILKGENTNDTSGNY